MFIEHLEYTFDPGGVICKQLAFYKHLTLLGSCRAADYWNEIEVT